MPQKTFAGGLAPQKNMKHSLLPAVLLYLPGACDNDDAADNAASDNLALAASSGPAVGEVFRDALLISGGEGPEMVVLPTGRFRMGDVSGGGEENERPVQTVTIQHRIAMGRYEVSFAEYGRFASVTKVMLPADEGWGLGRRPVIRACLPYFRRACLSLFCASARRKERGVVLLHKRLTRPSFPTRLYCLHCGARLYAEDGVKSFAVIRDKPRQKAFSHFRTRACSPCLADAGH